MSQENVDLVRRLYESLARRDGVAAFDVYAEDIIWDVSQSRTAFLYTQPVSRGHEGVRRGWREWLSAFSEIDVDVEELKDAGDQVLAVLREREVGRASGVRVEATHVAVWTLADGKVIRMQMFDDLNQALKAARLEEEAVSQDSVVLFQRWIAAVGRGDVDYVVRHSTTDVMFIAARSAIEGPFVGHEGLRRFVAEIATDFEVIAGHYEDVRDLGDDRVLAIGTIHFRGRAGGVDTHVPSAGIAAFREGKLSRWEDFRERNAALKAVGLEE